MYVLSQARPLGGLHRASPVPFRGSYFTSGLHPPDATPQGLMVYLYRPRGFPPITPLRFVAHSDDIPGVANSVAFSANNMVVVGQFPDGNTTAFAVIAFAEEGTEGGAVLFAGQRISGRTRLRRLGSLKRRERSLSPA